VYDFFLPVGKWLKMGLTCVLGSQLDYRGEGIMPGRNTERVAWKLIKVRQEGGPAAEILKMMIEPTMCMKTQATTTKWRATNTAFYKKMHQLNDD
jgi:hypothetical protein